MGNLGVRFTEFILIFQYHSCAARICVRLHFGNRFAAGSYLRGTIKSAKCFDEFSLLISALVANIPMLDDEVFS